MLIANVFANVFYNSITPDIIFVKEKIIFLLSSNCCKIRKLNKDIRPVILEFYPNFCDKRYIFPLNSNVFNALLSGIWGYGNNCEEGEK
jgi:hypothetical protein